MTNDSVMCEICGVRPGEFVCLRCRRIVCRECMTHFWLCKDCYRYKREVERDRLRKCDYIRKMVEVCKSRISKSHKCLSCIVMREMLISLYKMLRDLMNEARIEYYEDLIERLESLEPIIRRLLIRVLVVQGGLQIPGEVQESETTYT